MLTVGGGLDSFQIAVVETAVSSHVLVICYQICTVRRSNRHGYLDYRVFAANYVVRNNAGFEQ